ncbi:MAG TPA: hypothetical protein VG797_10490 [Phycisphaerales bacterium]|nr:hypothetical protein [Phycisphaerales bacterium]
MPGIMLFTACALLIDSHRFTEFVELLGLGTLFALPALLIAQIAGLYWLTSHFGRARIGPPRPKSYEKAMGILGLLFDLIGTIALLMVAGLNV